MRPPGRALWPGGSTPGASDRALRRHGPPQGRWGAAVPGGRDRPRDGDGRGPGLLALDGCRRLRPALETAKGRGCVAGGAIFRSGRGSRCTGSLLAGWAREDDVRLSVGRTGCRRDDAVAESLWASLKNEMCRRRTSAARDEAKFACIEWIEGFHDRRRPHSSIGYRHPADVMADFKRRMEEGSDFLAA